MHEARKAASRIDAAEAPRGFRWGLRIALVLLGSGALYLIAVRHEAILIDLANLTAWCF